MDEVELEELRLYDPDAPDAADRLRLLQYLLARGATKEDLIEAARIQNVGGLALELAFRRSGDEITFAEAAEEADLDPQMAAKMFRALGFPDPLSSPLMLNAAEVQALKLLGVGRNLLGEDTTHALVRVMGATTYRLAQALIDSFRVQFELPQQAAGASYSEVVERYGVLAEQLLPQFLEAFGNIFRRHMVSIASNTWSFDEEASTAGRDLVVGFVDLVGYTEFSSNLSSGQLAGLINRFEDVVTEIVSDAGGRLVKLVGDGAMFVNEDPDQGCRTALEMSERFSKDVEFPPVRVGLAAGMVMSLQGDYFGSVVNLAARLMTLAKPSVILVSEEIRDRASNFRFVPLPTRSIRGFEGETNLYELRRGPS